MTTMTLQEINEAIDKWQEETGSTFIFLAIEKDNAPLCHYAGKSISLSSLVATAISEDDDMATIVKMALRGVELYNAAKQPCGSMN